MISINREDKIPAGGVDDAHIADIVNNAVAVGNKSVLMRYFCSVRKTSLDKRAKFILFHIAYHLQTICLGEFIWKSREQRPSARFRALVDIGEQHPNIGGGGLVVIIWIGKNIRALIGRSLISLQKRTGSRGATEKSRHESIL